MDEYKVIEGVCENAVQSILQSKYGVDIIPLELHDAINESSIGLAKELEMYFRKMDREVPA